MRGMLLKDLLNLKQLLRVWLMIMAIWIVVGIAKRDVAYIGGMLVMLVIMVPVNVIAYDESSKWDSYALTLPITRRDVVLSKYVLTMLCALVLIVTNTLCGLLLGESFTDSLGMSLLFAGVGLCIIFFFLPILFQFGTQKARVIMMLFILIPALVSVLPGSEAIIASFLEAVFGQGRPWLLAPVTLALFAVSYMLSLHIYERKAF
ncbi:MAG: ABC-2 transporter permease [Clostridiales bacterium]|nr:ABC-2 transporter permease [Clostridiales bacterium]